MKRWQVFMLSSLWEGLPCAVVEARLLRLPVISYNTGGIYEVITDEENGLLYAQGDWQGLSDGMLRMMGEATLYRTCQQHQDALTDFAVPHMVQEHILLYQQLLSRSGHNQKIMPT
jgi:glycosyltransferase involved in cell wall biosynthesis